MTEQIQRGCTPIGQVEKDGSIVCYDLMIIRDGFPYSITVATPDYANEIDRYNANILDPSGRLANNFYKIADLSNLRDPQTICQRLSKVPFSSLQQYLTPMSDMNPPDSEPKSL